MSNNVLQIDLDKVLADKAPDLARKLPRFVVSLLKKIIYQEGINAFLRLNGHRVGVDFASSMIDHWQVTIKLEGVDNIPASGRFVFASNHPLGGLDGVALTSVLGQKFDGEVRFVVNDILMNIAPLSTVFVPINKHGGQGKNAAEAINAVYQSDLQVLFFPAGLVSRFQNGKIEDLEWKKAFIAKAKQYERDVVPVYFDARNSVFFYAVAYFRKLIGLKANIEMLLLPRELFKQKGKTVTIRFGKPVSYRSFDSSKTLNEWASEVKRMVYQMKKGSG